MCREHVITYDLCRHGSSNKKLCPAAEHEAVRVQKRATWCCIFPIAPPRKKVVYEVEYKTYRQPGFCDHCKAVQRRERAPRQVRECREAAKRRAAADQLARDRREKERIRDAEARAKARQAAERSEWMARAAQQGDHGDSFEENPLYAQVMDLLAGPEYQGYMPPPPPSQSAARQETRGGRQQTRSTSYGLAPPPLSERRVQAYAGRKPQRRTPTPGPAPVTLPVPRGGMAAHRRQRAGARKSELQVITNGDVTRSRNQVVQNGGRTVPLPKQKQKQAPVKDYSDPMPDDEFLDFVERYV